MEKDKLIRALRVAIACIAAILTAELLSLNYPVTAGMLTILTIQNTKKETLKTAARRGIAFVCAMLIAWCCFAIFGYTLFGFGVYVFFFVFLCLVFSWQEAMSIISVLISHFFMEKSMSISWICNETQLFLIGAGYGILVNMLLLKQEEKEFQNLACAVDEEIKEILVHMSENLKQKDKSAYSEKSLNDLKLKIEAARNCAVRNYNNSVFGSSDWELEYVEMRQKQGMELEDIYRSIKMIEILPKQASFVAGFMDRIVEQYHRDNDVHELLEELEQILDGMKETEMPHSREEFEARAVLFYMLKQLDEFLILKHDFVIRNREKI